MNEIIKTHNAQLTFFCKENHYVPHLVWKKKRTANKWACLSLNKDNVCSYASNCKFMKILLRKLSFLHKVAQNGIMQGYSQGNVDNNNVSWNCSWETDTETETVIVYRYFHNDTSATVASSALTWICTWGLSKGLIYGHNDLILGEKKTHSQLQNILRGKHGHLGILCKK